ncbi:MAG: 2-oxo acid dehydrogenase subunit E2 [Ruminococcaceae bacterium]|nr:2-oxo acid dehydrogenase subunit E2 [Oscillospiraceae bacterium]
MASIITMPKQGLMMTEGTITQWLVAEGEPMTAGKPLFEMETDKLTITMDAEQDGILLKIIRPVGDCVPITEPIAIVGNAGEDISGLLASCAPAEAAAPAETEAPATEVPVKETKSVAPVTRAPGEKVMASPRAKLRAEENGIDIENVGGTGPDGFVIERDVLAYKASQPAITPLAANIAKAGGIDLTGISGSGTNGKIMVADLAQASTVNPAVVASDRGTKVEPMSGMRKAIARNMMASKTTNAQTSHRITVDMTAAVALRKQLKEAGIKVSYNDIILRVCAKALTEFPIMNASTGDNEIIYHNYVNIGVAVSVDGGLIVPVVKDADLLNVQGIAARSAALIEKAREGKLAPDDYKGGTFTVSSLGMFDLDDFVAIINPPESAILAVGKIAKTPVVITNAEGEDEIAIRSILNLTLSYDHRIIDGAEAAQFLQRVKQLLQTPALLI